MNIKRKEKGQVEKEEAYLVEKANVSSMKLIWMEKTAEQEKKRGKFNFSFHIKLKSTFRWTFSSFSF